MYVRTLHVYICVCESYARSTTSLLEDGKEIELLEKIFPVLSHEYNVGANVQTYRYKIKGS